MLRPSYLMRRTASAWVLVGCLMLSVFITTALVTALLSFYSVALPATVDSELTRSGALSITVNDQLSGPPSAVTRLVSTRMRAAFGDVPYELYQGVWSNDIGLPGTDASGNVPALQVAAMDGLASHADLTSGRWPTAPVAGQPIPVALPVTTAADLRLGVGTLLTLHYLGTSSPVSLRVTGLFRPRDPAATYWRLDLISVSGVTVSSGFASYGPAIASPAAFSAGVAGRPAALQTNQVSFEVVPQTSGIGSADLDGLAVRLDKAISALQNDGVSLVSTAMPQTLVHVSKGLAAARALVLISGLQLLLLAAAALALAGRLLASQRDEETALLAARGAARWQLVRPSLAEGLLACAVAAAAGAIAGVRLTGLLLSSLVGAGLRAVAPSQAAWLAAALVLVFCLGIAMWPALRPAGIAGVRIRRGRQAAVASVAAAGADIALIALALVAVHELLTYSAASGGSGTDVVIAAAPTLALAGLALVPLRLLPLAAKGLEKITERGRRLGTAMANWEISRRPVRQSGPALLVILAVGTSTLALAQYQSWQQSVHDQAAFAAGAQVRVSLASAEPLSNVTQVTRLRGVTAAMPVSQQPLGSGQLLVIGGPQAPATVTMRPDLSTQIPLSQLWGYLDQHQGRREGLPVPGHPVRLEITASMAGGLKNQLGPVSASVIVQDAYGLTYALPAGSMAADGRPHPLVAQLGPPAGAAYPLRLLSISLTYNMPLARAPRAAAPAVIEVGSIALSNAQTGPFAAPFASGRELAGWRPRTSATGLDEVSRLLDGDSYNSTRPLIKKHGPAGADYKLTMAPGSGPVLPPSQFPPGYLASNGYPTLPAEVQLTIPPPPLGVPLLATQGYLRANGLGNGSGVPISIAGTAVRAYVLLTVSQFPSVTTGSAVIADQANLQDAVVSAGGAPLPATSWWLSTAGGQRPRGLPAGSSVVDAAAIRQALLHDPESAAPIKGTLAVAAAAAVLAALGFCVSVAASARSRRGQRALLAALGVPSGAQARLFCLEEIMISGPAALVGLAVGIGLAHLLIPAITLTATAGLPVPPVLVRLPAAWVGLIAIAVPAIPVLAAAITTLRQPDPASELRTAEAAG
jgi:hypothetical protein